MDTTRAASRREHADQPRRDGGEESDERIGHLIPFQMNMVHAIPPMTK